MRSAGAGGSIEPSHAAASPLRFGDEGQRKRWIPDLVAGATNSDAGLNRNPIVIRPNIGGEASNGFAHGIDRVLRPIDLP